MGLVRLLTWACGLLLAGHPRAMAAPPLDPPTPPPAAPDHQLEVDLWLDGAITVAATAGWAGVHLAMPEMIDTDCPCTRDQVNPLDRVAVDAMLPDGELWADVTLMVSMAGSLAVTTALSPPEHVVDDALLVLESAALAGLSNAILKAAFARPYPYMYGPAPYPEQNSDGINYAAFPSGHTAVPMAAAVTVARIIEIRRPTSRWRWVAWTVGPALALLSGGLQVAASNHFPTDVLGGAALGAGIGLGNVWLHAR